MTDKEIFAAVKKYGSERAAAAALNIPRTTFQYAHHRAKRNIFASRKTVKTRVVPVPKRKTQRFIFTSAQDSTDIHQGFWTNLVAYAEYLDASIHIGGFTYQKGLFEDHSSKRASFHQSIAPYMCSEQIDVGGKLLFCGEINTQPTATTPLSGFETYTRSKWGVFPHPRVCLQSVATMFHSPPKQIMTTGAVTRPNYVPKKAGIKAEFHHVIGAVLVELDSDGDIFARHLSASESGSFWDLTAHIHNGVVYENMRGVEAITWGDIHLEQIDPVVRKACWKEGGMLDTLEPNVQFMHDTLDFQAKNHHSADDPYHAFKMWFEGKGSVGKALDEVAQFLRFAQRPWLKTVIVESNHDVMFKRWLKEADYRRDPENAILFLSTQLKTYLALERGESNYSPFIDTLHEIGALENITVLNETDSFIICPKNGGGIECALHGHRGSNGAKGHFRSFAKMGPKANVAHTHSPAIYEGIYCAGTSSKLDMSYNRGGLSSWSHSHIVTYLNGKRTILTMQGDKWRAK